MSDKSVIKSQTKKQNLGRGLGSLLGGGDGGAFSKTTAPGSVLEDFGNTSFVENTTPKQAKPVSAPVSSQPSRPTESSNMISQAQTAPAPQAPKIPDHLRIWQIGIEKVVPNPNQPRQIFDKSALEELAASIREKGIIQPLLVRRSVDNQFEIIAGERRWRAAQMAGLKEVPALIKDSSEKETLELALIENIQRENLNPVEEAEAYDYLMETYNLTQQELADRVGKERATVANLLRLLNLTEDVRKMVSEGSLALGQAKVLMGLTDASAQKTIALQARNLGLSVRSLEKLVAKAKNVKSADQLASISVTDPHIENLRTELQKMVGSKVGIDYNEGKGRILLHFYSDDGLNDIVDRLRDAWLS